MKTQNILFCLIAGILLSLGCIETYIKDEESIKVDIESALESYGTENEHPLFEDVRTALSKHLTPAEIEYFSLVNWTDYNAESILVDPVMFKAIIAINEELGDKYEIIIPEQTNIRPQAVISGENLAIPRAFVGASVTGISNDILANTNLILSKVNGGPGFEHSAIISTKISEVSKNVLPTPDWIPTGYIDQNIAKIKELPSIGEYKDNGDDYDNRVLREICGNGWCEKDENFENCPADCKGPRVIEGDQTTPVTENDTDMEDATDNSKPYIVSVTSDLNPVYINDVVTWNVLAKDPDNKGDILYRYTVCTSSCTSVNWSSSNSLKWSFPFSGTYSLTVDIIDGQHATGNSDDVDDTKAYPFEVIEGGDTDNTDSSIDSETESITNIDIDSDSLNAPPEIIDVYWDTKITCDEHLYLGETQFYKVTATDAENDPIFYLYRLYSCDIPFSYSSQSNDDYLSSHCNKGDSSLGLSNTFSFSLPNNGDFALTIAVTDEYENIDSFHQWFYSLSGQEPTYYSDCDTEGSCVERSDFDYLCQ